MDDSWKETYNRIEDWHFWARARRELIVQMIRRTVSAPKPGSGSNLKVLDIGCSAGNLLMDLQRIGFTDLYGVDVSTAAIALAEKKGLTNVSHTTGTTLKFDDGLFDIIIASDVLEHIEDPIAALKEWRRVLKPDGHLFVFVPAFQWMWTSHDDRNGHFRRYSKELLQSEFSTANIKAVESGFWNNVLFLPAFALLAISKFLGSKFVERGHSASYSPGLVNAILLDILRIENWLLRVQIKIPFGLTTYAVGRPITAGMP